MSKDTETGFVGQQNTCDGIHWGIADTKNTDVKRNKYPGDQPYYYYDVLKNILTGPDGQPRK